MEGGGEVSDTPQSDGAARYCRQSIPKAHWLKHMQTICRAFEEENIALRAHAERLAEALEELTDDKSRQALTLYRAENPKV